MAKKEVLDTRPLKAMEFTTKKEEKKSVQTLTHLGMFSFDPPIVDHCFAVLPLDPA